MINYQYSDAFLRDSTKKELFITVEDGTVITNEDLFNQTATLEESLCSEQQLSFGACEASVFKFKVANIVSSLKGKWLTVEMAVDGHSDNRMPIGRYKVESDTLTADRQWREITAYDAMYDIVNADASGWYNGVFSNANTTFAIEWLRNSFANHFGISQETVSLINDNVMVKKTIEPSGSTESAAGGETLSGKDVLGAICAINGCFGHIGRDGRLHYVYLPQEIRGLYPANDLYPADDLYPRNPKGTEITRSRYISCKYEDYFCKSITKVNIRQQENDAGVTFPNTPDSENDNVYVLENNFLLYGKTAEELAPVAQNILSKVENIVYRPFLADCVGNPCLEVGDPIRISTRYGAVESYVLKRTLKGIQALRDDLSADGLEKRSAKVNSPIYEIAQLKGRTNILQRDVGQTISEIQNLEENLGSRITQTESSITSEVTRATAAEGNLGSRITQTESAIMQEVRQGDGISAANINILSNQIVLKVDNAGHIAEVQLGSDPSEGSILRLTSDNLELYANDILNIISGGTINLTSKNIRIESDNFSVTADGEVQARAINITGGTIHIETGYNSNDSILLKYKQDANSNIYKQSRMDSAGFMVSNHIVYNSGNSELHYDDAYSHLGGGTLILYKSDINTRVDPPYQMPYWATLTVYPIYNDSNVPSPYLDCSVPFHAPNLKMIDSGLDTATYIIGTASKYISFSQAFENVPVVVLTPYTSSPPACKMSVYDITRAGFTAKFIDDSGSSSITFEWIAVG